MNDRNKTAAERALPLLDLTSLNDDDTEEKIRDLCRRAVGAFGSVAAVCIWPRFLPAAGDALSETDVRLATVVNFPRGDSPVEEVKKETEDALEAGADEIDLVFPWRAFLADETEGPRKMVESIRRTSEGKTLKVILETGELKSAMKISQAGRIALDAGADFLKTSTGKTEVSATLEAANAMLELIRDSGRPVGFKASGGIRTTSQAADYLALADLIMGPSWATPETFRFGASSLLNDLLETLGYTTPTGNDGGY